MEKRDPLAFVHDFDSAWNAHTEPALLDFFAPDAVVRLESPQSDPEVFKGEAVQIFVRTHLPGFQAKLTDAQPEGNGVTWHWVGSSDAFQARGLKLFEAKATAELDGDKVVTFTFLFFEPSLGLGTHSHKTEI